MHQLIHVPKTGGTSLYVFLVQMYPEHFQEFMYAGQPPHELKAKFVPKPVVIVREPVDRLFSMFRYWRSGSEMFSGEKRLDMSFSSFLDEVNVFNIWKAYIGPEHLLPQTYWISPDSYKKTILIRYREDLDGPMRELVRHVGLPEPEEPLPRLNVTLDREPPEVSDADMEKVFQRYKTDFILWEMANKRQDLFEKVI